MSTKTAVISVVFAALFANPPSADAQPSSRQPAPTGHWVLLRNGEVLNGKIERAGSRYRMTFDGGRIMLPKEDIMRVEGSLEALYDFRSRIAAKLGGEAQFDLARWCLKQKLYSAATKHLEFAAQLDIDTNKIQDLRSRIKVASTPVDLSNEMTIQTVASRSQHVQQPAPARSSLSTEAMRSFTRQVQPLLINRCSNAGCHGRNTDSGLEFARPHRRGLYRASLTQRNAAATQPYIHFADPTRSELLRKAAAPHGGARAAPLNEKQIAILQRWLEIATGQEVKQRHELPAGQDPSSEMPPADLPPPDVAELKEESAREPIARSDDPFDPEEFNRLHASE